MMNQKLMQKNINLLIKNCVVSDREVKDCVRRFFDDEGKSYHILSDDATLYYDVVQSICKVVNITTESNIDRRLISIIRSHKLNGSNFSDNDLKNLLDVYKNAQIANVRIFKKVHGLCVLSNEPREIGGFIFYDSEKHRQMLSSYIQNLGFSNDFVSEMMEGFSSHKTWVSSLIETYIVPSIDNPKINEDGKEEIIATEVFECLQSVLRWLISFSRHPYDIGLFEDVGILDYKVSNENNTIILGDDKNPIIRQSLMGSTFNPTNELEINAIINYAKEKGIVDLEKVFLLCRNRANETKMDKRLISAIKFYGRAFYNLPKPVSLLESVASIEALVGDKDDKIRSRFGEYLTFLLSNSANVDSKIRLEGIFKKLYDKRSALAHGSSSDVKESDCKDALHYAKMLIFVFLTKKELVMMKTLDDLDEYIKKLKFAVPIK